MTASTQIANISWRAVWAEFFAMLLFVFIGCGTACIADNHLLIALAFGLAITSLVYTFAHVSGAQINCAVTWALVLNETISAAQGLANFFAQMLGSMIGAFFIQAATSPNWQRAEDINYGANALGNLQKDWHTTDDDGIAVTKITKGNAFTVEFLMTFLLVTVVLQTAVNRDSKAGAHAAIAIGFAVFLAHAVCIPLTGCSINPTRSFGPAIVSDYWDNHWLWWVGPMLGSTVAYWINKNLLGPQEDESEQKKKERAAMAALEAEDSLAAL